MKAAIVYDSGTHMTKKMKSWADVFVAYFQRGIKRNIVPRLGLIEKVDVKEVRTVIRR